MKLEQYERIKHFMDPKSEYYSNTRSVSYLTFKSQHNVTQWLTLAILIKKKTIRLFALDKKRHWN